VRDRPIVVFEKLPMTLNNLERMKADISYILNYLKYRLADVAVLKHAKD
jgi:hypothetical protein